MSNATMNGAMTYRPNWRVRFWQWLGFRYAAHAGRPDDEEAKYTIHRIVTRWDWRDRFLLLISGTTETELCVETETLEAVKGSRSREVVIAPGYSRRLVASMAALHARQARGGDE